MINLFNFVTFPGKGDRWLIQLGEVYTDVIAINVSNFLMRALKLKEFYETDIE